MRRLNAFASTGLAFATLVAAACMGAPVDRGGWGAGPDSADGAPPNGVAPDGALLGDDATSSAGPDASGAPADPNAAGAMVLRHLTQFEYLNTVRDLLGDTSLQPAQVPAEPLIPRVPGGFSLPGLVDTNTAQAYEVAAEAVAANVATKIATLLPCPAPSSVANGAGDSCATQFISAFGQRAFRRPLSSTEASGLLALYHTGLAAPLSLTFNGAIGVVIEAILQSPGFLYHWEQGPTPTVYEGSVIQLDGYAIANRLSYFLWGTMPDQTLFAAAGSNQLSTVSAVSSQASRMLQDPKARAVVANFFEQWLSMPALLATPKDATVYPNYTPALQTTMDTEFRDFVTGVVFDRSGRLPEIFTSTATEANADLAVVYGVAGVTGANIRPVTVDSTKRSGLLTSAAFLAYNGDPATSNPVHRGHAIYTKLLCGTIPPPPANVPPPAPPTAAGTTRDHFHAHDSQPCATGCHSLMDPFGYPFEHFDGIGQYRTVDNGLPVDSTSTVTLDGQSHDVMDAVGLIRLLAQSQQVSDCFATQWFRFALGRDDTPADAASLQAARAAFATAQYDVRQMLVGLSTSRTFRYRTPSAGEVLP